MRQEGTEGAAGTRPGQPALPQGQHLSVPPTAAPASCAHMLQMQGWLLQDLASAPEHLVIAKTAPAPRSGPRHQAAAVSSNLWQAGLTLRAAAPEEQGGKLGEITAAKRHFPH